MSIIPNRSGSAAGPIVDAKWQTVSLGDVCDIQLGKMLSPASKRGVRPIPYLRNANVQWDHFDLSDVSQMDFSEKEEAKFQLKPGDLLVCEGGEPGRAAVWRGQIARCCYQKALHRIRPDPTRCDPEFLMFRFWYGSFTDEFRNSNAKTTIAHLPATQAARLSLVLPEISEQRRIASRLREQLDDVAKARAAVAAQLEAAKKLPAALLRSTFGSREAQTWPSRRLGDVLTLRKEVIHPRDNPSGGSIFVGLEHVESHTGRRIGSLPVEMAELTGRKPRFYPGDIVYGYLRPYLNKVWVAEFDGLCSVDQYVYELRANLAVPSFVAWFMRSPVYLTRAPIGTTPGQLPRIRTEEVSGVEINLPSVEVQRRVVALVEDQFREWEQARDGLESRLSAVDRLPAALLREAFSGRV